MPSLMHCHCSMCRKHHGAPFATFAAAPAHSLRWQHGEASVQEYPSSASRVRRFCGTCGSVAPTPMDERVLLPAGNLLGELGDVGGLHMFVGSKAPWHVIADELPQHENAPPGWPTHEVTGPVEVRAEGGTHGACLCGGVAFSVSGAPARWLQCHCSRCRRGRSAAHGSNAFYPVSQFEWRAGRELVRSYRPPDAERFIGVVLRALRWRRASGARQRALCIGAGGLVRRRPRRAASSAHPRGEQGALVHLQRRATAICGVAACLRTASNNYLTFCHVARPTPCQPGDVPERRQI